MYNWVSDYITRTRPVHFPIGKEIKVSHLWLFAGRGDQGDLGQASSHRASLKHGVVVVCLEGRSTRNPGGILMSRVVLPRWDALAVILQGKVQRRVRRTSRGRVGKARRNRLERPASKTSRVSHKRQRIEFYCISDFCIVFPNLHCFMNAFVKWLCLVLFCLHFSDNCGLSLSLALTLPFALVLVVVVVVVSIKQFTFSFCQLYLQWQLTRALVTWRRRW